MHNYFAFDNIFTKPYSLIHFIAINLPPQIAISINTVNNNPVSTFAIGVNSNDALFFDGSPGNSVITYFFMFFYRSLTIGS